MRNTSLFSLRKKARERAGEKWGQLVRELADSSMVSGERLEQAATNMEERARTPVGVLAGRYLRRRFRPACV